MSDDKPALTIPEMTALIAAANRSQNIPDRFSALEARVKRLELAFLMQHSLSQELVATIFNIRKDLTESEKDGIK